LLTSLSQPRRDEMRPRKNILVVEDNELNRKLLTDILSFQGHEIIETPYGLDAIRIARELHPDLILLDIQLPDISGFDVARRLKEDTVTCSIPIIAATAFGTNGGEERALQSGCDGYVAKPINVMDFLAMIARCLGLAS
jgi:two-component system, cell cycle response regulator DivK